MSGEPAISLRFEHDNPCNTSIVDPDGNILYTVATDLTNPDKPVTRVHDGIRNLVAEWIWRESRSDLLTIRDHPQAPASAWLKKSFIPFWEYVLFFFFFSTLHQLNRRYRYYRSDVKFQDDAGVEYVWKNNKPGLALQVTHILFQLSFAGLPQCADLVSFK
jgi:hypothetical protein